MYPTDLTPITQLTWSQTWAYVPHWTHTNNRTDVGTDVSLCTSLRPATPASCSRNLNFNNNYKQKHTHGGTNTQRRHTHGRNIHYTRSDVHTAGITYIESTYLWRNNQTKRNTHGRGTARRGHTHGGHKSRLLDKKSIIWARPNCSTKNTINQEWGGHLLNNI